MPKEPFIYYDTCAYPRTSASHGVDADSLAARLLGEPRAIDDPAKHHGRLKRVIVHPILESVEVDLGNDGLGNGLLLLHPWRRVAAVNRRWC